MEWLGESGRESIRMMVSVKRVGGGGAVRGERGGGGVEGKERARSLRSDLVVKTPFFDQERDVWLGERPFC